MTDEGSLTRPGLGQVPPRRGVRRAQHAHNTTKNSHGRRRNQTARAQIARRLSSPILNTAANQPRRSTRTRSTPGRYHSRYLTSLPEPQRHRKDVRRSPSTQKRTSIAWCPALLLGLWWSSDACSGARVRTNIHAPSPWWRRDTSLVPRASATLRARAAASTHTPESAGGRDRPPRRPVNRAFIPHTS